MVVLPLGQDKPDFVKRRVRKLLTAGVVSALACVVKSENPALTNSCRELISRYGAGRGGNCCKAALPPGLVLLVNPSFWKQEGVCGHPAPPGLAVSPWVVLGLSMASPQFQLLLPCLQGVLGPGGGGRGPRLCGRTRRRKGELTGATVPLACSAGGLALIHERWDSWGPCDLADASPSAGSHPTVPGGH